MKIAVSGKGGVGKTTVSSNLAKLFSKKGYNVFAVDADPDSSLGLALGISNGEMEEIKPIIDMREFIDNTAGDGALYLLNPDVSDIADRFSIQVGGIKFLRMGGIKTGGSSCYCRENNFLKALVNSLLLDVKDVVILDMSAGIEHLTRGTAKGVDLMLIVTEPGKSSVETARNVRKLSNQLDIENVKFIGNKVRNEKEALFLKANFPKDELLGLIHYSEEISDKAMGLMDMDMEPDNAEIEGILEKVVAGR